MEKGSDPGPSCSGRKRDLSPRGGARILVVLHGAIGDVVRAMPTVLRIRRALPAARIAWAVEPAAASLLEGHPAIDEVLVFRRERGTTGLVRFLGEVRRRRFDLVLDLQRHLKSGVVSRATGAPRRIGFHRRNSREGNWLFQTESIPPQPHWANKVRQYLAFAEHLGASGDGIDFGLTSRAEERRAAETMLAGVPRPRVAAFVGSTWPSRWWAPERVAEVLLALDRDRGAGAVLLGGPGERALGAEIVARAPRALDLVGRTSLREAMAILGLADVAFGPDSGPMHVAAAVGTPVVSLWGPTSPLRSAPAGWEKHVIVGEVACHPCYRRSCPIGKLCMERIEPAAVVGELGRALDRADR